MSRAVVLSAKEDEVSALCAKLGLSVSTLEALPDGGCRVVLVTLREADVVRLKMKGRLVTVPVARSGQFHARRPAGFRL